MQFNYAYSGSSQVKSSASDTSLAFSPDLTREPAFFRGELTDSIPFREAISALHDVVISDLRYKPQDRSEYLAWAARQEDLMWGQAALGKAAVKREIEQITPELEELRNRNLERERPFLKQRQKYFDYLYKRDYDAWFVLDPVITVHPDEIFFECFSQDESSYGRLSVSYEHFKNIGEFACGTTNIDYSQALYNEFQKIRSYKSTHFTVDPSGFEVDTSGEESYKEVKIDLPDSWVRGFLQVNSAMCMPMTSVELHPLDIYNICLYLRRHREIKGPRSIRFILKPGAPVRVSFDPWNDEISCPRSIYKGDKEEEIRLWGRRRLHILERLIPVARKFTLYMLGTGMPSFYVADLGSMAFTLGLSGWTANDWSRAGNFDLLAPRGEVDELTKENVFNRLKENWYEDSGTLANRCGLDRQTVLTALSSWAQAGRAIYDLNKGCYRVRELSRDPLPLSALRFANPREEAAAAYVEQGGVKLIEKRIDSEQNLHLRGEVNTRRGRLLAPSIVIDRDERLIKGECSCSWYYQNKLYKGPCEHMLAIRKMFNS